MILKNDKLLNFLNSNNLTYIEFFKFIKNYIPEDTEEDNEINEMIYELINDNNVNLLYNYKIDF